MPSYDMFRFVDICFVFVRFPRFPVVAHVVGQRTPEHITISRRMRDKLVERGTTNKSEGRRVQPKQ